MGKPIKERFYAKVRIAKSGCHEWTGWKTKGGYGQFCVNGKVRYAHRVAWQMNYSDPGESYVLHKCDNRCCVNPEHLFLGTFQDNMDDMRAKKRHAFGTRNGQAKLDDDKARAILASGETLKVLANRYNVGIVTVWQVRAHKTWLHV